MNHKKYVLSTLQCKFLSSIRKCKKGLDISICFAATKQKMKIIRSFLIVTKSVEY